MGSHYDKFRERDGTCLVPIGNSLDHLTKNNRKIEALMLKLEIIKLKETVRKLQQEKNSYMLL